MTTKTFFALNAGPTVSPVPANDFWPDNVSTVTPYKAPPALKNMPLKKLVAAVGVKTPFNGTTYGPARGGSSQVNPPKFYWCHSS